MNAWVFRHLDELRRIYGATRVDGSGHSSLDAIDDDPESSRGACPPGGPFPGAVERREGRDGDDDVILTPGRRRPKP